VRWWVESEHSYILTQNVHLNAYTDFNSDYGSTSPAQVPRPTSGIWNQIEVGAGKTMQQAISDWWAAPSTAAAAFTADKGWNSTGVPPQPGWPPKKQHTTEQQGGGDGEDWDWVDSFADWKDKDWDGVGAPLVPWYSSHFMTNPYCVGYPWY
jgi:hypothetical protein